MTKTLIVHHTSRTGSHTKDLVEHFAHLLNHEVEMLDLSTAPLPRFDTALTDAYVMRNFAGQTIENPPKDLELMDTLNAQLMDADNIVVAFPMYNFSMTGATKTWFDSVIQAGKTFTMTPEGPKGTLGDKKGLIITTSGSDLSEGSPWSSMEHSHSLARAQMNFVGIDPTIVYAHSTNNPEAYAKQKEIAIETLESVAKEWNV